MRSMHGRVVPDEDAREVDEVVVEGVDGLFGGPCVDVRGVVALASLGYRIFRKQP